MTLAEGDRCN